ncbi:ATP-binding cassette domain-containing protein [Kocuria palustris]|uniref:ABC transporter ATP-binding protein n=1 Tax=Kocuria palustris TaxID=71999 RepID=UPI0019583521|nr:ABC transporter ATP-binding protein [Kocuria palustris]MBM7824044.1 energy-coupling factor transport system ATP-binding protein [Kocuria palustris]MDH5151286.1 ABC transporter ATP-binding protein [Kocuria palustris]
MTPLSVTARGYGWTHAGRTRPAFSGLDLHIEAGQRVLLAGASGVGKSTLLHAITGVLPAVSGDATGSLLVGDAPPAASRGAAGLVLQDPDSQVILARVGDDVAFGMENLGLPAEKIPERVRTALETVGLPVEPDHPTLALSGGQKQRLAIAGVLAMEPGVIVLDEPTANLDPDAVHSVRDAVLAAQARSGATMVVVEHRLEIWAPHVDRILVLGPEGLLADGDPNTVLGDMRLRDCLQAAGLWLPGAVPGIAYTPTTRGEEMLCAKDITVARPGAEPVATVSAQVRAGRALALTGPNGSGKSTTALTLAGLIPEDAGTVTASQSLLAGPHRPKCAQPSQWKSRSLVTRIGMVFQEAEHQFLRHTVAEELAFGPRQAGYSKTQIQARVDELLERLKLDRLAQAHPQTLSGGEKRRLSVACMLTAAPQVLIVDEPTFGQDALTWRELTKMFAEELALDRAIVAVTHDEAFAHALSADRLDFNGPSAVPAQENNPAEAINSVHVHDEGGEASHV